ncbi:MAG: hypothetical protein ABSC17_00910 [Thermacetogeniaceae bacterium]
MDNLNGADSSCITLVHEEWPKKVKWDGIEWSLAEINEDIGYGCYEADHGTGNVKVLFSAGEIQKRRLN